MFGHQRVKHRITDPAGLSPVNLAVDMGLGSTRSIRVVFSESPSTYKYHPNTLRTRGLTEYYLGRVLLTTRATLILPSICINPCNPSNPHNPVI